MASIKLKGDVSGEVTISAPSVAGTTTLELPATSSTLATQNSLGVRNLIINGDMRIAQRGTSSTGITSTFSYHTVDRWFTQGTSSFGTFTQTQDTDVPSGQGFANSLKMQCTTANASLSAGSYLRLEQRIEGQNLQHLKYGTSNAESLTLSFWVKSNKTGTYVCWLYQDSTVRGVSASYTISSSDTWEKKTITFSGDTSASSNIVNDNSSELRILFQLVAGTDWSSGTLQTSWGNFVSANSAVGQVNLADSTSNYINITGVQLEVGTEATPFEHRPYDMELQRCQRYYEVATVPTSTSLFVSYNYAAGNERFNYWQFKQTKRSAPTIALGASASWAGATASSFPGVEVIQFYHPTTAFYISGTAGVVGITASAEL
jgi:hypothetical protein